MQSRKYILKFGLMKKHEHAPAYLHAEILYTGPEVKKLFSCSTELSMAFYLLINVKMPTIFIGILTFMSGKNNILGLSEPKKAEFLDIFILMSI